MSKYLGPIVAILVLFAARDSQATVVSYLVSLYGSVDASGSTSLLGHGRIDIDTDNYLVNWNFDVPGVTTLKEATIRFGAPGSAGPQVVRLRNEMHGQVRDADLSTIVLHPNDYYIMLRPKVDTTTPNIRSYRGIRGQLAESSSSSVPEPTTLTLLGLALVGGGVRTLRRRKSG